VLVVESVDFKTAGKDANKEDAFTKTKTQLSCYSVLLYREATGHREGGSGIAFPVKTKSAEAHYRSTGTHDRCQQVRLFQDDGFVCRGVGEGGLCSVTLFQCLGCEFRRECRLMGLTSQHQKLESTRHEAPSISNGMGTNIGEEVLAVLVPHLDWRVCLNRVRALIQAGSLSWPIVPQIKMTVKSPDPLRLRVVTVGERRAKPR